MGGHTWSSNLYNSMRDDYSTKSTDEIFKNKTMSNDMNPKDVKFRECRDSAVHPNSLAVMVWGDVTGSMGRTIDVIIREKLGTLMETLIEHDLPDAAVFFGAIGDHTCDNYPLQVGQFECGTAELNKWLTETVLEKGGGGQLTESYLLAWFFGANHTSIDCFEKRGIKGVLFTIGDERSYTGISASELREIFGGEISDDYTDKQLLDKVREKYRVFHIHVNEASYKDDDRVLNYWRDLLGEDLIILEDHKLIAEVIATATAMAHGLEMEKVVSSFDNKTALAVKSALSGVKSSPAVKTTAGSGVVNL